MMNARFVNPDKDPRGPWSSGDLVASEHRKDGNYIVKGASGKEFTVPEHKYWVYSKENMDALIADNGVWFGANGTAFPRKKRFLSDVQQGRKADTWWVSDEVGHNQEAKREIQQFNQDEIFTTPKPERLIQRILTLATKKGDLVLDSFAGSGTTGAVAHKMGRKWIMCGLGGHCHTHILPRMKAVIDGEQGGISKAENWKGGGGFKYYRLAESLLVRDKELSTKDHPVYIINPRYDAKMLIRAVCKIENFRYRNDGRLHGISSESRFLHITAQLLTQKYLDSLAEDIAPEQSLLVYCTRSVRGLNLLANVEIKKIPRDLLSKCDFQEEK